MKLKNYTGERVSTIHMTQSVTPRKINKGRETGSMPGESLLRDMDTAEQRQREVREQVWEANE